MPLQSRNVFVDTQSFDRANFEFESRTLQAFRELCSEGELNHITTTIVVREVKTHISESIRTAFNGIKEFRRKARILSRSDEENIKALFAEVDEDAAREHAIDVFDSFLDESNSTILEMNGLNAELVINDYFNTAPPFQDKKKTEFPDAFNMLAIQAHIGQQQSVYIVSEDKDLIAYCNTHPNFIHIDKLTKLLDLYNEHDAQRSAFIKTYVDEHTDEIKAKIMTQLEEAGAYNSSTWEDADVDEFTVDSVDDFDPSIIYLDDTSCHIAIDTTAHYSVQVTGPDFINGTYDRESGRTYTHRETTRQSEGDVEIHVEVELDFAIERGEFVLKDSRVFVPGVDQGLEVSVDEWEEPEYH